MSIHPPSLFIQQHWQQFLPRWTCPVQSVLIYLQRSPAPLGDRTAETEAIKAQLRTQFLRQSEAWRQRIVQQGYQAEAFDPKFGTPLHEDCGPWMLDDVAIAQALLKFPVLECGGCKVLEHPQWQSAVFPSTLLSTASPDRLKALLAEAPC